MYDLTRFLNSLLLLAICFDRKTRKGRSRLSRIGYTLQFPLCFFNRRASVVGVFFVASVVGDALDHDFGIVAAGEGALRVSPIVFGLAFVVSRGRALALSVVTRVPGRFGRVFVNCEIAERVNRVAFLARLNDELLGKFVVTESRQA